MPKAVTKAEREKLRRAMEEAGSGTATIAREMQRQYGLRPRESFRHALGLSQEQAAAAYNEAEGSGNAPMSGARVSAYENWPFSGERPSPRALAVFARAYGTTVGELIDFHDRGRMPSSDRYLINELTAPGRATETDLVPLTPPSGDMGTSSLRSPDDAQAEDVRERSVITDAAQESAAFAHQAGRSNIGPTDFEQLEADLADVARQYLTRPLVPLFADMRELRDRAFGLIEGHQYPDQTRHLYLIAGYACSLLANASCDLGYYSQADTQARTAWLCAELAGHNKLRGWVLATRSLIAFWDRRLKQAVTYADQGAELVGDGVELVRLRSLSARARARRGDEAGARAAIQAAEAARERVDDDDLYQGMLAFPAPNQDRCAGSTHLWLGQPEDAQQHLHRALQQYEAEAALDDGGSYAHLAVTRMDLALSFLQEGDLEAVREVLAPVLALPPEYRLAGVVRRTNVIQRMLTGPTLRKVALARGVADQIEEFAGRPASRLLPGASG